MNSVFSANPVYLWVFKMFLLVTFQNRHFLDNPQHRKKVFKGTSAWKGGRRLYRDPDTINFIALNGKKRGGGIRVFGKLTLLFNTDVWNTMLLGHFTYKIIEKIHTEPSGKVHALSLSI